MQKLNYFIIALALIGFPILHAQTTILDQTLLTQQSFNTFTAVSVTGGQDWYFDPQYGAICSGYFAGQSHENEDWFVSPAMNLSGMGNAQLTFSHTRGNAAVMNVGVAQGWYKAFATASYTGNPSTTQWIELTGLNQNIPNAWQYISSGSLVIPAEAKSEHSRIAFRYISSAAQSATWEIKNVKVTANPDSGSVFKITNWNTEWLGCTTFGPSDEDGQIENVVSAMLAMDSDIYCLQEISNTASNPSIETIVSLLGSDEWGGTIVPSNTGDCNQRQGIIYKKSKVQFVSSSQLSNGSSAQGNSYSYNWSSGRFPALYNVNLVVEGTLIPVSFVNIHAKAEDDNAMSYTRRKGGSEGLKTILDGSNYNTKNLIIIGDFNDYLIGTTSNACQCTISPYKNFMDDPSHYTGITKDITDVNTNWGIHPIIEHMIISDELADNYIGGSVAQEVDVPDGIFNYYNTTSNHLPVSALFQFSVLGNPEYSKNSLTIYPNPVKDELTIDNLRLTDNMAIEIYDLTGRQMACEKSDTTIINVSTFPTGIYILKIGNRAVKFVKE